MSTPGLDHIKRINAEKKAEALAGGDAANAILAEMMDPVWGPMQETILRHMASSTTSMSDLRRALVGLAANVLMQAAGGLTAKGVPLRTALALVAAECSHALEGFLEQHERGGLEIAAVQARDGTISDRDYLSELLGKAKP